MKIHGIAPRLRPFFTARRRRLLQAFLPLSEDTRLVDVGGEMAFWRDWPIRPAITLVNTQVTGRALQEAADFQLVIADGRQLPFPDNSFDVAFSNSVIEHLSDYPSQQRFAAEIRRVAERIWVQTPAKWFPVEPHFLGLFIHYFPRHWQRRLVRYFTLWGLLHKPKTIKIELRVNEIRLLSYAEMQKLFPDCQILKERFLFLTKSYIAVK